MAIDFERDLARALETGFCGYRSGSMLGIHAQVALNAIANQFPEVADKTVQAARSAYDAKVAWLGEGR